MPNLGDAKQVMWGSTPAKEVYYGSNLIWRAMQKVDVLRGLAAYRGGNVWERGASSDVSELGVKWTVMAPMSNGESFSVGGVKVRNLGGTISISVTSNRATMSYSAPGNFPGTPLVSVSAAKDWYGYRTRLWVDGVSRETGTNGGAFKPGESTAGGSVSVDCRWVAYIPNDNVGDPHKSEDVDSVTYALLWGVAPAGGFIRGATTARHQEFLPALPDYRWVVSYRGYGGDAGRFRGGTAGASGVRVHGRGEPVEINFYFGDKFIGDFVVSSGSLEGASTSQGEDSPVIPLPWGDTLPSYASPPAANSDNYSRPGTGGSVYPDDSDGKRAKGSIGGAAEIKYYLWP